MVGLMAVVVGGAAVQVLAVFSECWETWAAIFRLAAAPDESGHGGGRLCADFEAIVLWRCWWWRVIKTGRRVAVMRTLWRLFPPFRTIEAQALSGRFASVMRCFGQRLSWTSRWRCCRA
jgi:hypothetical protein